MYKIILIFLLASFGVMGQDLGIVDSDTLKKPKTGLTRLSEKAGKLFFRGATGTKKEIVSTNNSYANPSWIPSIALTKVTGLQESLSNTVKKIAGKSLSSNDYTTAEKSKLAGIKKEVPLFIFIGESNAEGRSLNSSATASELLYRNNVKIWNVDSTKFSNLKIGVNNIWNDNIQFQTNKALWHGWELELANRGLDRIGYSQIFLVKAAQGGSVVADWDDVTDLNYTKFVSRVTGAINAINALGYSPKIYIFQSLGINDAIAATNSNTFLSRLTTFHSNIRSFLGVDTPIIQTQIMQNNANYIAINDKIIAITDNVKTFNVSVSGLTLLDSNHWDYAGMKVLANRMLDIAVDVVGLPDNKSGRLVSNTLPTWDYAAGNAITNFGISKTIIRPTSTAIDWQAAPFRVEAFNNVSKFGYGYYNTSTNRFVIGAATAFVSNDPVEIAPLSTTFVRDLNSSGVITSTAISNSAGINVGGLLTATQINANTGFFQLSSQNGSTQNQAIMRFGNSGNLNSYGWISHDNSDNITYLGSVLNGVAHKDLVLAPISPSKVGIGKKPTQELDVLGTAAFSQSVGIGTTTINPSAALDIASTNKGVLIPRTTTAQKNAISSPATGLLVFDTDLNKISIFLGTWRNLQLEP